MAQTITKITRTNILTNLDTYNYTATAASMYVVSVQLNEVPPSGMNIAIQLNGSNVATMSAPAASQSHMELSTVINAVVSDVLTVILSSSSAIDKQIGNVKAILNIHQGSN